MAVDHYGSKVDAWLIIVCLAAGLASVNALLLVARTARDGTVLATAVATAAILGLLLWVMLGTRYRFDGAYLKIISGPFHWTIRIGDIVAILPTRSPLSGPALSLDRLSIEYGDPPQKIMISPRDKAGFLKEFERRRGT